MSGFFCIHCGSELEQNSQFCTVCGKPVAGAKKDRAFGDASDRTPANDRAVSGDPLPAIACDRTQQMGPAGRGGDPYAPGPESTKPTDTALSAKTAAGMRPVDASVVVERGSRKKPMSPIALGAMVFAAALLVFGGAAVLLIAHPWDTKPGAGDVKTATVEQPEKGASSADPSSKDPSAFDVSGGEAGSANAGRDAVAEDEVKSALLDSYGLLAGYDDEVRSCATDFNNTYLSGDLESRKASLATCRSLKDRIDASLAEAEGIDVPTSSSYYENHQDICTLYDDLSNRIRVIIEAWEIGVRYESPADHQEEIEAPIARDNVDGKNKYYTDYQERYEHAKP